jgi:hypothetical protein
LRRAAALADFGALVDRKSGAAAPHSKYFSGGALCGKLAAEFSSVGAIREKSDGNCCGDGPGGGFEYRSE